MVLVSKQQPALKAVSAVASSIEPNAIALKADNYNLCLFYASYNRIHACSTSNGVRVRSYINLNCAIDRVTQVTFVAGYGQYVAGDPWLCYGVYNM